jgi:hypothetical protein
MATLEEMQEVTSGLAGIQQMWMNAEANAETEEEKKALHEMAENAVKLNFAAIETLSKGLIEMAKINETMELHAARARFGLDDDVSAPRRGRGRGGRGNRGNRGGRGNQNHRNQNYQQDRPSRMTLGDFMPAEK